MSDRKPATATRGAANTQKSPWATLINDRRFISTARNLPGDADLALVQEFFARLLPAAWTSWVLECGTVAGMNRALLGLRPRREDPSPADREDALDMLMLLRLSEPAFGDDLLPVEILPERQMHCLVVGAGGSPVVLIDLDRPDLRIPVAKTFNDFVYDWRNDLHAMAAIVEEISAAGTEIETVLVRPDEWSTRRLCSQNVIVGLLQTRHNRDSNEHDVAVFATATLTSFAAGAGTRWALTTVLTEAHQAGGSLAVNFVRRSRSNGKLDPQRTDRVGQRIPPTIIRWASAHSISLDWKATGWDHDTGEQLLVAATRLPDSLRSLMADAPFPKPTICAAVSTGAWPALDVEIVLRWSDDPTRILTGAVDATDRLRYLADQQVIRSAMLLSSLLRHLERIGQVSASDEDDTRREVTVNISAARPAALADPALCAATFTAGGGEPARVGWPRLAGPEPSPTPLTVRALAFDADVLAEYGPAIVSHMTSGESALVPADALARSHHLTALYQAAESAGVTVLAAPDYTTSMDVAIAARLNRSRMSRQ
jgi:hypothetical protein